MTLSTVGFVIGFSTFLLGCVDYSRIREDEITRLSDVVVDHCVSECVIATKKATTTHTDLMTHRFSGFTLLFFLLFAAFYAWQIITFIFEVMRLVDMYKFYTYLLRVPDVRVLQYSPLPWYSYDTLVGRHPDHLLARNCAQDRRNPRRKPHNSYILSTRH